MTTLTERPDTATRVTTLPRVEGLDKVTGRARYAVEYPIGEHCYAWPATATIGRGRVVWVDADAALATPGVLAVLWHANAPRLNDTGDRFVWVLQDDRVAFRGQVIGLVVAASAETAREVAETLEVTYADETSPDVVLREDDERAYQPDEDDSADKGRHDEVARVFTASPVQLDRTYTTPAEHNLPMEPHATTAVWTDSSRLTVYDSNQGASNVIPTLAQLFGIERGDVHVINEHVGGGFGSKGTPRSNIVLAAMAARVVDRPVKLALTRQHMFDLVGFRTPTIQRMRLGADLDGTLHVIWHDSLEEASTLEEYTEGATAYSTSMYGGEHRLMTQRLVRLDVPQPSWMRAPGETPGSFAAESAMDELAELCGLDPIELRIRNEPPVDPDNGREWASRNLVACLRDGAARFGWSERPDLGGGMVGRWRVGYGMAASMFPAFIGPSTARARYDGNGHYTVGINATDIGTGARTALVVLAAEALGVTPTEVTVEIGDSRLPRAASAGGSTGTMSWGTAVDKVCRALRIQVTAGSGPGTELTLDTREDVKALAKLSRAAYGAQFAEVRVDTATGEVRVPRMTGVFACGRIVNAETARSQLIGGMTMGVGMALLEEGVPDASFGGFANHDFGSYHIPSMADTPAFDVTWLDEVDDRVNPIGAKGIGEIGIVGTAAAVANAVYNATGVRIRDLPITPDKLL